MRILFFRFCLSFLLFVAAQAKADMMIPMSVEEISSHAQLILHGKVVSTTVLRDTDGQIYTKVDLQVNEVWKGSIPTNHFTIVLGGGILGDEGVSISGQVEYEVGEEVVAFLVLNERGQGITVGLSQGKFQVTKDSTTGELLARNRFHGKRPAAKNRPVPAIIPAGIHPPPNIINRLTLAELKQHATEGGQ